MDEIQLFIERFLKDLKKLLREVHLSQAISKQDLWTKLSATGNFELLNILRHVELQTVGFSTIIEPPSGFVHDVELNDLILKWLKQKHVNVLNVNKNIKAMSECLQRN